jgi:hypothetical protein
MQTILDVPYRSQRDTESAGYSINDCGPCCVAMLIAATGRDVDTDQVYRDAGITTRAPLSVSTIQKAGNLYGLNLERHDRSTDASLEALKSWIDRGRPALFLLDYRPVMRAGYHETAIRGGHFALVVGYDDDHVYVHDPYWKGEGGAYRKWRTSVFMEAWFQEWTQYQQIALVPAQAVSEVTDPPYPVPPEIERRLRARAIYEATPAPHVYSEEDYEEALLWLGTWGEDVQTHVIAPGETLGGIAEEYFGSAQHYRTIAVYNGILNPSRLAVGDEVLIPLPEPIPAPGEVVERPAQPAVAPPDEAAPTEEPEAPAPAPPAAPAKVYPYTNQQVINAFYAVFTERGERERFWEYIVLAGLAHLAEHRGERFRGPDIQDLPNLDDDMKAALLEILGG